MKINYNGRRSTLTNGNYPLETMRIVLIGAGNLASQLAPQLAQIANVEISQIYSRTKESAQLLASTIGCEWVINPELIREDADLYIFSLKDSALESVLREMKPNKGIWVHTAGSIPMDIFQSYASRYGVFYPLQTFSKNKSISLKNVPFFIEGSDSNVEKTLLELARLLSDDVRLLSSDKRKEIHLAAVFVCNFTNHMYTIAADILEEKGIPFEVLIPLIEETTQKLSYLHPKQAQTGPAVRFDENVINKHLSLLNNDYKAIYRLLSESIYKIHSKE